MATDDLVAIGAFSFTGLVMFFLAMNKRYDAGIVGLIGSGITCFSVLAMIVSVIDGYQYNFPHEVIGFVMGIAVFFLWYVYRFLRKQWKLRGAKR
jgi:ABC-type Fe3+-siderophore transport system permease subunit